MTIPAIQFVYADWVAAFPSFGEIIESDAQMYFDGASTLCANDTCSPAFPVQVSMNNSQVPLLKRLLWLLTCHLAYLGAFRNASGIPSSSGTIPPVPVIGRVSSASEGSVSITSEFDTNGYPVPAFFQQTPWGLQYWQALAPTRTMQYSPRTSFVPTSIFPSAPPRNGWR